MAFGASRCGDSRVPAYQRIIIDAVIDLLAGVTDAVSVIKGTTRRAQLPELPLLTVYVTGSRALKGDAAGTAIHREAHLFVEYIAKGEDAEDKVHDAMDKIEQAILDNPTINGAVRNAEFDEDAVAMIDQDMRVCGGLVEYACALETHCNEAPPALHLPQDIPEGVDLEDMQLLMSGDIRFARDDERAIEPGIDMLYYTRDPRPGEKEKK